MLYYNINLMVNNNNQHLNVMEDGEFVNMTIPSKEFVQWIKQIEVGVVGGRLNQKIKDTFKLQFMQPPHYQGILNLLHMLCYHDRHDNTYGYTICVDLLLDYMSLRDKQDNKMVNNDYSSGSDDEDIFRIGTIKWFNDTLKEYDRTSLSKSKYKDTIPHLLVALSKVKVKQPRPHQNSSESLVFETLDIIWRLHIWGDKDIAMLLSIFKHYELNKVHRPLRKEIKHFIFDYLPTSSTLWYQSTKDIDSLFKQLITQDAYKDDYFIPPQQSGLKGGEQLVNQKSKSTKLESLVYQYFKNSCHNRLLSVIQDYSTILLDNNNNNNNKKDWKGNLIFLNILNMTDLAKTNSNFRMDLYLLKRILLTVETNNSYVHCQVLEFLSILLVENETHALEIQDIKEAYNCIINNKESIQPMTLFTFLCHLDKIEYPKVHQDIIDRVFELSLLSGNPQIIKKSKDIFLYYLSKKSTINHLILSPNLDYIIIDQFLSPLSYHQQEDIFMVINYLLNNKKRSMILRGSVQQNKNLTLIIKQLCEHNNVSLLNRFMTQHLLDRKDMSFVYLPCLMKRILVGWTADLPTKSLLIVFELFQQQRDKLYPYKNKLISLANKHTGSQSIRVFIQLLWICVDLKGIHHQETNQLFQLVLDIVLQPRYRQVDPLKQLMQWLMDASGGSVQLLSVRQRLKIVDWIESGIIKTNQDAKDSSYQMGDPEWLTLLRQYSQLISLTTKTIYNDECQDEGFLNPLISFYLDNILISVLVLNQTTNGGSSGMMNIKSTQLLVDIIVQTCNSLKYINTSNSCQPLLTLTSSLGRQVSSQELINISLNILKNKNNN
ncbi:hypothetical protein DFA_10396 [Cavenderia fasciculata]|uniref:Uncharacterized protein n=1 Tax=Cavenderia fasciculata TaxID=261658 RepID=F4QA35_CACFS|nr:uncharacterized protein DFA_10396 [Cavenderia fasciculata]EGG15554.1 hypothetical protein DFA_10396 [Cavenderia fasciculata]|eukprot:XP_004354296.1 hypothetical protein DFA_10396 [Cavenderia fasciculata]